MPHREVQNLSTALGLPSVVQLLQSPYTSKTSKPAVEKSSNKTGGANAMLARSKALVRESYIATDIIAKVRCTVRLTHFFFTSFAYKLHPSYV